MRLPDAQVETAKKYLSALYDDAAELWRTVETGNISGSQMLFSEIPCHLSVSSKPPLAIGETSASTVAEYSVYLPPEWEIISGDTLKIRHKERKYVCVIGTVHKFSVNQVCKGKVEEMA